MHTGWSFYPKAGPGQGTLEKSQGALASRSFLTGLKGLDPVPWVGLGADYGGIFNREGRWPICPLYYDQPAI